MTNSSIVDEHPIGPLSALYLPVSVKKVIKFDAFLVNLIEKYASLMSIFAKNLALGGIWAKISELGAKGIIGLIRASFMGPHAMTSHASGE